MDSSSDTGKMEGNIRLTTYEGDEVKNQKLEVEIHTPVLDVGVALSNMQKNRKNQKPMKKKEFPLGGDLEKYERKYEMKPGSKKKNRKPKRPVLRKIMKRTEKLYQEAVETTAKSDILYLKDEPGYLVPDEGRETWHISQNEIKDNVDVQTAEKRFDLRLDSFGPYSFDFTRNGRFMIMAGRKGHVSLIEWQSKKLLHELFHNETVRDVKFFHNETFYAVAQKKYTYVYDKNGVEVHCLKQHMFPNRLEFLPYHFLLASIGRKGVLAYQDVSIGSMISSIDTKLGSCDCMRQNPYNAVIGLGHFNGVVSMWSPTVSKPLVKMLCHKGIVKTIGFDNEGRNMVTTGVDGKMKIWDIRTYKEMYSYSFNPAATVTDVSQKGMVAISRGRKIEIWKDIFKEQQKKPYLIHKMKTEQPQDLHFCPFEDILGVGHSSGFSTVVVPGSGEPNFDSWEADPYQRTKQRKEQEIKQLLEKLPPDMISIDPNFVGSVRLASGKKKEELRKIESNANKEKHKNKTRHARESSSRSKKKQEAHWKEKRAIIFKDNKKQKKEEQKKTDKRKEREEPIQLVDNNAPSSLSRFKKSRY